MPPLLSARLDLRSPKELSTGEIVSALLEAGGHDENARHRGATLSFSR